ncbi:MAG: cupredoxin domain-containing protein [Acidimicrobiales bacterium]
MRRPNPPLVVLLAGMALAATACSSSGPSGDASTGKTITIQSFTFEPAELTAVAGATITVNNADGTDHTVTAVDGSFDTGPFSSGERTFKVGSAGRTEYRCDVHSFMPHGFIQVSA